MPMMCHVCPLHWIVAANATCMACPTTWFVWNCTKQARMCTLWLVMLSAMGSIAFTPPAFHLIPCNHPHKPCPRCAKHHQSAHQSALAQQSSQFKSPSQNQSNYSQDSHKILTRYSQDTYRTGQSQVKSRHSHDGQAVGHLCVLCLTALQERGSHPQLLCVWLPHVRDAAQALAGGRACVHGGASCKHACQLVLGRARSAKGMHVRLPVQKGQ